MTIKENANGGWRLLTENKEKSQIFYMHKPSISHVSSDEKLVWVKFIITEDQKRKNYIEENNLQDIKGIENFSHVSWLVQINLKNRQYRVIQEDHYDVNDIILKRHVQKYTKEEWNKIIPDSIAESILNELKSPVFFN